MRLYRMLTANVSPLMYFLVGVSQFIGFCFFTGLLVGNTESILYQTGTLFDSSIWGLLLLIAASLLQVGLCTRAKFLISLGGMSGFLLWTSASIDLAVTGHWYILVTVGLLHTIFHVYIYLVSSLGHLQ